MKIKTSTNPLTNQETFNIFLNYKDDIPALDLAESVKSQYPKQAGVIAFSKITKLEMGFIIVGLKI